MTAPIVVEYCKDGQSFSDFDVVEAATNLCANLNKPWAKPMRVQVSSANFITAVRLMVARSIIQFDQVEFVFQGRTVTMNKYLQYEAETDPYLDMDAAYRNEVDYFGTVVHRRERCGLL